MTLDFDRKISSAALGGHRAWRGMFQAESRGGNPDDATKAIQFYQPEKLIYAEGDSWFDAIAAVYENVHLIDQRGLLTPAGPRSEGSDADWFDEIHTNESGFRKLASERWEDPLAQALGWRAESGDELIAAAAASNPSTAVRA